MNINFPSEEEIQQKINERRRNASGAKQRTQETTPEQEDTHKEHYLTPRVLSLLKLRQHTWLVGPAGSGKSYVAEEAAKSLNLPFYCPPIGRETTNSQLFGYFNAAGNYVRTPLREAVENGGLLHLEEIDFASPAVGTSLNAILANRTIGFPDAAIPRHPDFVCIASANTYGTGATSQYIGSQGLNAATLNRFAFLHFPYDERMERNVSPNLPWTRHVQEIRKKVNSLQIKHVVSPRASINGGALINSKEFTWDEVESMWLFPGLDAHTIAKIRSHPII